MHRPRRPFRTSGDRLHRRRHAARARRGAVDPEQNQRSDDREDDAPQRETGEPGSGDQVADVSADECADDPDDGGDDDSTGILAWHDRLGDRAGNQAEHDPRDYTHTIASGYGSG